MSTRVPPGAFALLLLASACSDRPTPAEPGGQSVPVPVTLAPGPGQADPAARARHERFARRMALALRDERFRADVFRAVSTSRLQEGKVHFQGFLSAGGGAARGRLAALSGEAPAALDADLAEAAPIEFYLPVPSHRAAWAGGPDILVATAELDRERPVAFDLWGRRHLLSAESPPATPVLALGRAELPFRTAGPAGTECLGCIVEEDPGGSGDQGGTGSGTGDAALVTPGLYMTYATFDETFEGWLKGSPEFETHVLGQEGTGTTLKSYQCAGEHAGGPYAYDQNSETWSGRVLLFSQGQLDTYRTEHPGQGYRILVIEDDDTACGIRTDTLRLADMLRELERVYGLRTGGLDSLLAIGRTFRNYTAVRSFLRTVWSWITTQDDLVGTAIEDVVARQFWPGANWIVKGENNRTRGAIRLEMKP